MDRLVIEITGQLPEENKYAILAAAQEGAAKLAGELNATHKLQLTAVARPIRPGKKTGTTNGATLNGTAAQPTDNPLAQ